MDVEYPQKVFELDRIFNKSKKEETGINETESLCISIAGQNTNFTEIKQILDYLAKMLN